MINFMTMLFGVSFCLMSSTFSAVEINLTELGFYKPDYISITKVGQHYLLSAAGSDAALRIVDKDGKMLAEYTKAGRGPTELSSQRVLAVTPDKIYVSTKSPAILVFDHKLNLLPESKEINLLHNMRQFLGSVGFMTSEHEFTTIDNSLQEFGVFLYNLNDAKKGDTWLPYDRQIPKRHLPPEVGQPEITAAHRDHVFLMRPMILPHQTTYNVLVHRMIDGVWQPIAELSHDTDDLLMVMEPYHAFITYVYKTDQGFVVDVTSGLKGKKPPQHFQTNFDYFDEKGRFLRRVSKDTLALKNMINSPELFVVEERDDGDYLVPYEL